jgi:hypothetical protein
VRVFKCARKRVLNTTTLNSVLLLETPQRGKRKRGYTVWSLKKRRYYTVSSPSTARFCRKHKVATSKVEWVRAGVGRRGV